MTSHGSVAAKVRASKESNPEMFCRSPRCLWRTGGKFGTPCRNHPVAAAPALPEIVAVAYDNEGTTAHACNGCNSAWPTREGDDEPTHHETSCPWFAVLAAKAVR